MPREEPHGLAKNRKEVKFNHMRSLVGISFHNFTYKYLRNYLNTWKYISASRKSSKGRIAHHFTRILQGSFCGGVSARPK